VLEKTYEPLWFIGLFIDARNRGNRGRISPFFENPAQKFKIHGGFVKSDPILPLFPLFLTPPD